MTDPKQQPEYEENETGASDESGDVGENSANETQKETDVSVEGDLEEARREVASLKEAMLRMQAEMENLRKRLARDLERSQRRSLEAIMNDLVPVRDSLERGLEAADESASVDSLREGKALTKKLLDKALQEHGLEEIDPAGKPFDPELHEAMSMRASQHPANTVVEVVQKGYRLNDRLIRPARVVVSAGSQGN